MVEIVGTGRRKVERIFKRKSEFSGRVPRRSRPERADPLRGRIERVGDEIESEDIGGIVNGALKRALHFRHRRKRSVCSFQKKVFQEKTFLHENGGDAILEREARHGGLKVLTVAEKLFLLADRADMKKLHNGKYSPYKQ
jgi:hypothetical protein